MLSRRARRGYGCDDATLTVALEVATASRAIPQSGRESFGDAAIGFAPLEIGGVDYRPVDEGRICPKRTLAN